MIKSIKKILSCVLVLAVYFTFVGCSTNPTPPSNSSSTAAPTPSAAPTPTIQEIKDKIMESYEHASYMELKPEELKELYGIDPAILDQYSVNVPLMNVHASEIAIFKVKDTDNVKAIEEGINKRLKTLENTWKTYLPDQYALVKNHQIKVEGNYILFAIHQDADKIENTFDDYFESGK